MRYVIVGAGAIGGVIGVRLAQGGGHNPPVLVARGAHLAAIREKGLRIRTPDEDAYVPIEVVEKPSELRLRPDDVLVFATKTQNVEEALLQWVDQPVFDGETSIGTAGTLLPALTALNGVESERIALRYFDRVFGVCVWVAAVYLTPGEVVVRTAPLTGVFMIGRYGAAQQSADSELLATIEKDWEQGGFAVHIVSDVMRWKHRKLLNNLGNALQILVGPDLDGNPISARLTAEAEEIYAAAGIDADVHENENTWLSGAFQIRRVPGMDESLGGSSWQSVLRGGSIETDFLNGEIALMARTLGREAPVNATIQRLARSLAAAGAEAGSMTVEQIESELPS